MNFKPDFISNAITESCRTAYRPLENVALNGTKPPYIFDFDLTELEDYNNIDIRLSKPHEALFSALSSIKGPALYIFEVTSDHSSEDILSAFEIYKKQPDCKAVPALKAKLNYGSNVLYVGKVKRQYWGRFITHLGFYKVQRTQGLQLFYWGKNLGLKLRIHVYEFQNDMANYMPIVEADVAKVLQPLIGKHEW